MKMKTEKKIAVLEKAEEKTETEVKEMDQAEYGLKELLHGILIGIVIGFMIAWLLLRL
jgi:F0F1-type ATP synthase assembly protein I